MRGVLGEEVAEKIRMSGDDRPQLRPPAAAQEELRSADRSTHSYTPSIV